MNSHLIVVTLLSLFTAFRVQLGPGQLRPFALMSIATFVSVLARTGTMPKSGVPTGVVLLLPFLVWHVTSAFAIDIVNGVREAVQVLLILMFVWAVSVEMDRLEYRRLAKWFVLGMAVITAYSIAWHTANEYVTGWKRLQDPKATFTFIPLTLGLMMTLGERPRRDLYWLAWVSTCFVVLLSGERKALLSLIVVAGALLTKARPLLLTGVVAVCLTALVGLSAFVSSPYLAKQWRSVLEPSASRDVTSVVMTGAFEQGDSISNLQREYTAKVALQLFSENALLGIGTNEFDNRTRGGQGSTPEVLRANIHSEFLRVSTENGIVGLLCYLVVWLAAVVRLTNVLRTLLERGAVTAEQARSTPWVVFVPSLMYVGFEASATRLFIVLAFVSMLPDLVRHAFVGEVSSAARQAFPSKGVQLTSPRPAKSGIRMLDGRRTL